MGYVDEGNFTDNTTYWSLSAIVADKVMIWICNSVTELVKGRAMGWIERKGRGSKKFFTPSWVGSEFRFMRQFIKALSQRSAACRHAKVGIRALCQE